MCHSSSVHGVHLKGKERPTAFKIKIELDSLHLKFKNNKLNSVRLNWQKSQNIVECTHSLLYLKKI